MSDKRRHRGRHPQDDRLFAEEKRSVLRRAVAEMSWLLTRGYGQRSSLKLVGDHYQLARRQRLAVMRAACSDQQRESRLAKCGHVSKLHGQVVVIDGYNLLTTVEAALGGGVLLACRDKCCRDMASMHGSYRKVAETCSAIEAIGQVLAEVAAQRVRWLLDAPVSNSGRLKQIIEQVASERGYPWEAAVIASPDYELKASDQWIVTADSAVLDAARRYVNLGRVVVERLGKTAGVVDLDASVAED